MPRPRTFVLMAVAAAAAWVASATLISVLRMDSGLRVEYFRGTEWQGGVARAELDPEVSTSALEADWPNGLPGLFSAVWTGYLVAPSTGRYEFSINSDDGTQLYVDGELVVDNGGRHAMQVVSGTRELDAGPHRVMLQYFQGGGLYGIEWRWARDGARSEPVPGWLLSPRRTSYPEAIAGRTLRLVRAVSAPFALLLSIGLVVWWERRLAWRHLRVAPRFACLVLFVALAVVETWPLASDPAHLSRNDNGDTVLNEWTLAWMAHQAPRDPLHLYDGNIFYPEHDTIAYSEALIVQSAMGAPLLWAGASPVLTYNVLLMAGFALTGWAMCVVIARWTGDWIAGITAGIVMGFNAHTMTRMPHLQAQHVEFLPFALVALDLLLHEPRLRHALSLAGWFVLQSLTSFYLLAIVSIGLVAAAAVRVEDWWGRRRATRVALVAMASAAAAFVLLLPALLPYWRAYSVQGMSRSLENTVSLSARWQDYLTTPARVWVWWWLKYWDPLTGLFPGLTAVVLAGAALAGGVAFRDRRARMCLAMAVIGVVLSFGPKTPLYTWLYFVFPPLHGIRGPARFGYLGIVGVAVLAGFGLAHLRARARPAPQLAISVAAVVLVTAETIAAPLGLAPFNGINPIYAAVKDTPDAVVAELPLPYPRAVFINARYMLNSTLNWKPMINGYSGFTPGSYYEHYAALQEFPAPEAVAALARMGVNRAFVHLSQMSQPQIEMLAANPSVREITRDGTLVLYSIAPAGASASASALAPPVPRR